MGTELGIHRLQKSFQRVRREQLLLEDVEKFAFDFGLWEQRAVGTDRVPAPGVMRTPVIVVLPETVAVRDPRNEVRPAVRSGEDAGQ